MLAHCRPGVRVIDVGKRGGCRSTPLPQQASIVSTLGCLAQATVAHAIESPAVVVVGAVAELARTQVRPLHALAG